VTDPDPGAAVDLTPSSFAMAVDAQGFLEPWTSKIERRLADMAGMYADADAERAAIAAGDPLVYEVFQHDMPEHPGELVVCTTRLYPGRVGDEYFMTKGHYHRIRERQQQYQYTPEVVAKITASRRRARARLTAVKSSRSPEHVEQDDGRDHG